MFLSEFPETSPIYDDKTGLATQPWIEWFAANSNTYAPVNEKFYHDGKNLSPSWVFWFQEHSVGLRPPLLEPLKTGDDLSRTWLYWFMVNTQ